MLSEPCSAKPRSLKDIMNTISELALDARYRTEQLNVVLGNTSTDGSKPQEPQCMVTHADGVEYILSDVVRNLEAIQTRLV